MLIGALLLGLGGSWHCAAMCSGLALGMRWPYQLGRWCGYLLVATILSCWSGVLRLWLGGPLVLGLGGGLALCMGVAALRPAGVVARNSFSVTALIWTELAPWLRRPGAGARWLSGFLTAGLPCGLLGAAYLSAANQPGLAATLAYMTAFWLGTLPGLLLPGWGARRWPGLRGYLMIASGLLMLAAALWPETAAGGTSLHRHH